MKKIDIKDFMNYHYPTGMTAAPDGKHGVFAVLDPNEDENCYRSGLWLIDLPEGNYRPLTGGKAERAFAWLDSDTVLFISNREKEYQEKVKNGEDWTCFYTINIHGGEAEFAFAVPYAVTKMAAVKDKIVFCVNYDYNKPEFFRMDEDKKKEALKLWEEEKDYEVFDELPFWENGPGIVNKKRIRLAVYDRASKNVTFVSPDHETVENFWIEGEDILYTGNLFENMRSSKPALYLVDLTTCKRKELLAQETMRIDFACRIKGNVYVLGSDMKEYGLNENAKLFLVENNTVKEIADHDVAAHNSICSDCKFADGAGIIHDDEKIYLIATFRKQSVICSLDTEGNLTVLNDRQGSVHTLDKFGDVLYFTGARDLGLTEVYALENGTERKLTALNDAILAERNVCRIEEFTYTYKDVELDGYVLKPVDFDPNKKYPGILTVHGGPRATFGSVYFHENQAFANAGYFVFYTNPVGSEGRGNAFADLSGRYGTIDYEDLMAFTDEVLKRYPQIDEKRLGFMGGSYGGFMANWVIGHTDRFAAAASQRSISNWISLSMTTDIGYSFDLQETAADPWTAPDKMWTCSPLKYANNAKTPTLFIQSDQDYRCYMADALQMFSALRYFGVETRMCLFHGENHELSRSGKPKHRVRRLKEMMDWFEKYLK